MFLLYQLSAFSFDKYALSNNKYKFLYFNPFFFFFFIIKLISNFYVNVIVISFFLYINKNLNIMITINYNNIINFFINLQLIFIQVFIMGIIAKFFSSV